MDNKIFITNTGVVVTPYKKGQCLQLEHWTSVFDEAFFKFEPTIGFIVKDNLNNDVESFVTSKNTPLYMQSLFPNYQVVEVAENTSLEIETDFYLEKNISPSDIQSNVINEILRLENNKEWFVNLQTGFGKTLLSVYLISIFKCKSLIMCYSRNILDQWICTIRDKTTFDTSRILLIDSSLLLYKIYTREFSVDEYDIFMMTPRLLTGFCNQHGFSILYDMISIMGIGLKIFDEAHRNITNMIKINGYTNVQKTLYLSADFSQADKKKEKLYYKMMHGVPIIKPNNAVMDTLKYTQAVVVQYNTNPSIAEIKRSYTRHGFSSNEYMRYQFENGTIIGVLDYIMSNIYKTNKANNKILILVGLIEHVDMLYDIMKSKYGTNVGRFHSKVDVEEKEYVLNESDLIISTYQSFGTGIDVAKIKYVISLDQCNKIWDNQASGRARPLVDGSDAFYFMCIDKGFTYSIKKLAGRLKYLQETKIKKITKITYYPIK